MQAGVHAAVVTLAAVAAVASSSKCLLKAHAGLAVNGERTYIVGGKAHPTARLKPDGSDGKKQLLLADIFQYHVEENCWLQVKFSMLSAPSNEEISQRVLYLT